MAVCVLISLYIDSLGYAAAFNKGVCSIAGRKLEHGFRELKD